MDNPETLATLDTQDTGQSQLRQKTTQKIRGEPMCLQYVSCSRHDIAEKLLTCC